MILTQKVTSLAFSLHDGVARKEEDLTPFQKQQVIRKCPNPLEYYSYVLHFHAVMVGPTILFADYIDFINGNHFIKKSMDSTVSSVICFKLLQVLWDSLMIPLESWDCFVIILFTISYPTRCSYSKIEFLLECYNKLNWALILYDFCFTDGQ